jgi:hypothetical protein
MEVLQGELAWIPTAGQQPNESDFHFEERSAG